MVLVLVVVAALAAVFVYLPSVNAQDPSGEDLTGNEQIDHVDGKLNPPLYDNLDDELNELVRNEETAVRGVRRRSRGTRSDSVDAGFPELAGTVAVEVFFSPAHRKTVAKYLRKNGAIVRDPLDYQDAMLANVPIWLLPSLANQPGVLGVVRAGEPDTLNAGATVHGAVRWQGAGYGGSGVRIGVIDDGLLGYSRHIGTALPRPLGVRCHTRNVSVVHTSLAACESAANDAHGSNVVDMIFDVAPDAEYFIGAIKRITDSVDIVDWFIRNDVDVLVMSLASDFEGPGDGTSPYTNRFMGAMSRAVANGITVVVASGNEQGEAWYGTFVDSDNDNVLEWTSGDECNTVHLVANKYYSFRFRWEGTWRGARTDLDLFLRYGQTIVARSERAQGGARTHDPQEGIYYTPTRTGNYCISVELESGTNPDWAQMVISAPGGSSWQMEHFSNGYEINNPGELVNSGFMAVGAARHNATSTIESYSSRGPLPNGTVKPDIVGASGVHAPTAGRAITGTSFAAPHVGGLAALVKQRFPWYTPAGVVTFLKDHAQPRGSPVPNNTWGHGFAHLGGTPATGTVTITGKAEVGEDLTAGATVTDTDGVNTSNYRWQWYRVDGQTSTEIMGATNAIYTGVDADEGKGLAVRLQFDDNAGNHEELFSAPTKDLAGGTVTYVSNLDTAGSSNRVELVTGRTIAQPFRTGRDAFRYNVREVFIDVGRALPSDATYSVSLYSSTSRAEPNALLVGLDGVLTSTGNQKFTPASPISLEPDTIYLVVVSVTSLGQSAPSENPYVEYKGLDRVETHGWDMFTLSYHKSSGEMDWSTRSNPLGVAVGGIEVPSDNEVRFSHRYFSVGEGGTQRVWLQLARPAASAFTVPVQLFLNATTASSADYSGLPASVSFGIGDIRGWFIVSGTRDTLDDDDESFAVKFGTMPSGIVAVVPDFAYVLIEDINHPEVTVSFGAAAYTVAESDNADTTNVAENEVEVTVTLSADPERRVSIPIKTMGQDGATIEDYSGVPEEVTFVAGETERTITFTATHDEVDDEGESAKLEFGSSLPERVTEGTPNETTISITDDDGPSVTVMFAQAAYTVAESDNVGTTDVAENEVEVTVTLSADPERRVVIPIQTMGQDGATGADHSAVPPSVTFNSGDVSKSFTFTATHDTADDDGESVKLSFGSDLPAGVSEGTPKQTTVSITDDDHPSVTVMFAQAAYTVAESDNAGTTDVAENEVEVTVTLSADPERRVVIPIETMDQDGATSADYSAVPASVAFNSGDISKSFTFTATHDSADDDGESVKLSFGSGLPAGVTEGMPKETTVSITDDDSPTALTVMFSQATYTVAESDNPGTTDVAENEVEVKVELSDDPETDMTIPISLTNQNRASAADYTVPTWVTFASGDKEKAITFTATHDSADDDGESVKLSFGTLPSAPIAVTAGAINETTIFIIDDDGPPVTAMFAQAAYTVAESDNVGTTDMAENQVEVTVSLSADPERRVVIPIETMDQDGATSADYSAVPPRVAFNSGDVSKSFTFTAIHDTADDDGESVKLSFGSDLPTGVTKGTPKETTISITDDDDPSVAVDSGNPATGKPTISGKVQVRQILTADSGTIADADGIPVNVSYNYQWFRVDGATETVILYATSKTYELDYTDEGKQIKVKVSFVDSKGFNESRTSDAYPANDSIGAGVPSHCNPSDPDEIWCTNLTVGSFTQGADTALGFSQNVNAGSLNPATFTWRTATIGFTYLSRLGLSLTLGIERRSGTTPSDGLIGSGNFALDIGEGTNKKSYAVNNPGTDTRLSIPNTTGLGAWSVGDTVPIRLLATNRPGTGKPTVSGTAQAGQALTALPGSIADADGMPANAVYTYQWISVESGIETSITDAVTRTYTLAKNDEGKKIKVKMIYDDGDGNEESRTSDAHPPSGTVQVAPAPNYLSGTAKDSKIVLVYDRALDAGSVPAAGDFAVKVAGLTRNLGSSNGVVIQGRELTLNLSSAVTPGQAVTVAYTKPSSKPLQSVSGNDAATLSTTSVPNVTTGNATGKPRITGSRIQGRELYTKLAGIADTDGLHTPPEESGVLWCPEESNADCSFQWVRVDGRIETDIASATGRTYQTVAADVDKRIKVRMSFTDKSNKRETLTSDNFPHSTYTIEPGPRPQASVTDVSVSGPGQDNLWTHNEAIEVTVTLSQAIRVSDDHNRSSLACSTDNAYPDMRTTGHYVSGSGTNEIVFRCLHHGEATPRVSVVAKSLRIHGSLVGVTHDYIVVHKTNPAQSRTSPLIGKNGPGITDMEVSPPRSGGVWQHGDAVEVKVTFAQPVTVNDGPGRPYLTVKQLFDADSGQEPLIVNLPYDRVEGSRTVVFGKTLTSARLSDRIGFETEDDPISTYRGVIASAATGAPAVLTHRALGASSALVPPCGSSYRGEVWCARMTVGLEPGFGLTGYYENDFGLLSHDTFHHAGEDFQVEEFFREPDGVLRWALSVRHGLLDTDGLELRPGLLTYKAAPEYLTDLGFQWSKPEHDPGWAVGDRITVRMVNTTTRDSLNKSAAMRRSMVAAAGAGRSEN